MNQNLDLVESGAVFASTHRDRPSFPTTITLCKLDYLPRSKQRAGYAPYIKTDLKPVTLPFDAYCCDVDEAAWNERRKQGATHFEASNPKDGIWYSGAIF